MPNVAGIQSTAGQEQPAGDLQARAGELALEDGCRAPVAMPAGILIAVRRSEFRRGRRFVCHLGP
jgi:hypothetical protein